MPIRWDRYGATREHQVLRLSSIKGGFEVVVHVERLCYLTGNLGISVLNIYMAFCILEELALCPLYTVESYNSLIYLFITLGI